MRIAVLLPALVGLLFAGPASGQTTYKQFGNLNQGSVTVTDQWTKLITGTLQFDVAQTGATVEATLNSRMRAQTIVNANGILIELRIDDVLPPTYANQAAILAGEEGERNFQSIYAVFPNLASGTHTISVWALAPQAGGEATGVLVDPGGWRGRLILRMTAPTNAVTAPPPSRADLARLGQNYPNPFNPSTTIEYEVERPARVLLRIHDATGRRVRTLVEEATGAGLHRVVWDGRDDGGRRVASGNYFYQLEADGESHAKKLILVE